MSISPSHQFGQNFLVDEDVLKHEVSAARINSQETVLEIGAGIGNLTEALAERAKSVVALEYDHQFEELLQQVCSAHSNISISWGDAMTVTFPHFDVVVSNLPYRIALPLIFKLLEQEFRIGVVMIQKDMAERITARPGEIGYGRLSVTIQRLAQAELLAVVPQRAFSPPPDVASALLILRPHAPFAIASDDLFKRLLDYLFLHRDDRLIDVLQHHKDIGATARLLPKRIQTRRIAEMAPAEFGQVSRFLDSHKIQPSVISDSMKRKAQKL